MTATVLDTLAALDFNVPCRARLHEGDEPARWTSRHDRECCGTTVIPICEPCRLYLLAWEKRAEQLIRTGRAVTVCQVHHRRFTWQPAIIEPLTAP